MTLPSTYAELKVAVTLAVGGLLVVLVTLGTGLIAMWLSRIYRIHRTVADYSAHLYAEAEVRLALVQGADRDLVRDAGRVAAGLAARGIQKPPSTRRRRAVVWRRERRTPRI